MGSVVFTWGPFEIELAARLITILSPCFALDKVKRNSREIFGYFLGGFSGGPPGQSDLPSPWGAGGDGS